MATHSGSDSLRKTRLVRHSGKTISVRHSCSDTLCKTHLLRHSGSDSRGNIHSCDAVRAKHNLSRTDHQAHKGSSQMLFAVTAGRKASDAENRCVFSRFLFPLKPPCTRSCAEPMTRPKRCTGHAKYTLTLPRWCPCREK